jgi:hypothetical protein
MSRQIKDILVLVARVDQNYSEPGHNFVVTLLSRPGPGIGAVAGVFVEKDDAVAYASALATSNNWSLELRLRKEPLPPRTVCPKCNGRGAPCDRCAGLGTVKAGR